MKEPTFDAKFEDYRRERNFRRLQKGEPLRPLGKNADALREIEAAEAREIQDQRLTREVHEFFSDATQIAASIVQKVSVEHESAYTGKVRTEMQEFLRDAIQRAEAFMQMLRLQANGPEAEKELQTRMNNLLGPMLDEFRHAGTARLQDKHIGQNPLLTKLDALAEGKAALGAAAAANAAAATAANAERQAEDEPVADAMHARGADDTPVAAPWNDDAGADDRWASPGAAIEEHLVAQVPAAGRGGASAGSAMSHPLLASVAGDPEKLKKALKLLVQGGIMTKEQAREAYRQQLTSR